MSAMSSLNRAACRPHPWARQARWISKKTRPPLLITAGEKDHIIPASLNRSNYNKYQGTSITDFKEFVGRDHFVIGEKGWEEVADYSLAWLEKVA